MTVVTTMKINVVLVRPQKEKNLCCITYESRLIFFTKVTHLVLEGAITVSAGL